MRWLSQFSPLSFFKSQCYNLTHNEDHSRLFWQWAVVYRPLGGNKGNAEEQDKKDLNVEKGGHCHPLKTHDS